MYFSACLFAADVTLFDKLEWVRAGRKCQLCQFVWISTQYPDA